MKVILTEKVASLGNVGEVVKVSPGHGRNFLIPRGLAVIADESNKRQLEAQQKRLAKKIAEEKSVATELSKKLKKVTIELTKKVGGSGKLFGTVTNGELSAKLGELGLDVEKRLIHIDTPIKTLGSFDVAAKLFSGVEATFAVKVVMDEAQAQELKEKQALAEKRAAENKKAKKNEEEAEAVEASEEANE